MQEFRCGYCYELETWRAGKASQARKNCKPMKHVNTGKQGKSCKNRQHGKYRKPGKEEGFCIYKNIIILLEHKTVVLFGLSSNCMRKQGYN